MNPQSIADETKGTPDSASLDSMAPPQGAETMCDDPNNDLALANRAKASLTGAAPTALVLAVLAGLGLWGHHAGWTLPKFSELTGAAAENPDWCAEHNVPESQCVACNAELMPKGKQFGWCKAHGVHECPLCHPQVAQLKQTPEASQADLDRAAIALRLRRPRTENNSACNRYLRRIQFASMAAVENAGIDIRPVKRALKPVVESVSANAEIVYDEEDRVAVLSSRVPGYVWRVDKRIGDEVMQGEILALVDAVEVGRSKAELLKSLAQAELENWNVQRLVVAGGAVAGKRIEEAKAAHNVAWARVESAQQTLVNLGLPVSIETLRKLPPNQRAKHLRFLGLPANIVSRLDPKKTPSNLIPLKSPLNGVVVARRAVVGQVVDTAKSLFTIADTTRMWLMLDVRQEDARYVSKRQTVHFSSSEGAVRASGKISWISTQVDDKTRTVRVRAELPNLDGRLRSNTFGAGNIVLRETPNAIVVPSEAVHWDGCCHLVFVQDKNFSAEDAYKVFHTRSVRPGVKTGRFTEIIAGLLPGEIVVTKGGGALRAELLKGNLGAG